MKYSRVTQAPSAVEAVRVLTSDQFVQDFAAEIPVTLTGSEREETGGVLRHVMRCQFHTHDLHVPKAFRSVLPDEIRLVWDQVWTLHHDDEATAVLRISTHGKPSSLTTGTAKVSRGSDGVSYRYKGETQVSVPLIGKRIASAIDDGLVAAVLDDQLKVLARHFA